MGQVAWRGDRVVDGTCLENKRGETHREFESRPLRQLKKTTVMAVSFNSQYIYLYVREARRTRCDGA